MAFTVQRVLAILALLVAIGGLLVPTAMPVLTLAVVLLAIAEML